MSVHVKRCNQARKNPHISVKHSPLVDWEASPRCSDIHSIQFLLINNSRAPR
ncbi:hypothetical protein SAMD00019534_114280 [Acytostelium subglobosum LB1]|uniref:hypothetical protein n=1 Tax=Acytostelium subglobosum LB1 TaxID=1410327 RepID=UPI000644CA66|nr:hypothetical protein SAMD00019534_114280 [Acytostelium subglobosum LB1]GAM28252.1 hypothetical protein SAMD00019534_114280 [Acytostelium subglobosum LB1]|eukprot:XP_012748886.1 hypothetical protein SAMD00019534_114280 [Acytostelium subglobosum LB1]